VVLPADRFQVSIVVVGEAKWGRQATINSARRAVRSASAGNAPPEGRLTVMPWLSSISNSQAVRSRMLESKKRRTFYRTGCRSLRFNSYERRQRKVQSHKNALRQGRSDQGSILAGVERHAR